MTLRIVNVTVDCAEPAGLAAWWAKALGGAVIADYGGYVFVRTDALALGFQRVGEPRRGKNSVHLDLGAADRPAEVARLTGLGAAEVGEHSAPGMAWTIMRDPEGNEFCVCDLPEDSPAE